MSDPQEHPPEVPDEFAAAYWAAYQEAMKASAATGSHRAGAGTPEPSHPARPAARAELRRTLADWRRRRWFLPVVAGAGALVLITGSYLLGTAFSDDGPEAGRPPTDANGRVVYAGDSSTAAPGRVASTSGKAWRGDVEPVTPTGVRATCTEPAGVDGAGNRVSYRAANVADGDDATAWRCAGTATGVRLVLRLPGPTPIGEVGLVPGYAKTDPVSGSDRYAQNNRITRVRWTIGDITVEQRLDDDPADRELQLLRIPRATASRVTLEVLDVARGPRNTTAISEIRLAAAD
jgi:hypothetical protein